MKQKTITPPFKLNGRSLTCTFYIKTIYTSVVQLVPTLVYSFNLKRAMLILTVAMLLENRY